jgi:hypothetical protein
MAEESTGLAPVAASHLLLYFDTERTTSAVEVLI